MRVFTIIWLAVGLLILIIFIGMFTSSFTLYALNGESLANKNVGINKYSTDKYWLQLENAIIAGKSLNHDKFLVKFYLFLT